MIKYPLSLLLVTLGLCASAQLVPDECSSLASHMNEVNEEWSRKGMPTNSELISFEDESERIGHHLRLVIELLRAQKCNQNSNKESLLDSLLIYANAGRFPKNTEHQSRQPYFIDNEGTACAVGHLMRVSGHAELASKVRQDHNYAYIRSIKTPGVSEWAEKFGFTLNELAWIQPTYCPNEQPLPVNEYLNGTVRNMVGDEVSNRLYFSGDFTSIGPGEFCDGIAYISGDQTFCVDAPEHGLIESMLIGPENSLVLIGEISENGLTYPCATQTGSTWELIGVPDRPNAIGIEALFTSGPQPELLLIIDPNTNSDEQELWFRESIGEWIFAATILGEVTCSHSAGYDMFGGSFTNYINHISGDSLMVTAGVLMTSFYPISEYELIPLEIDGLPEEIESINGPLNELSVVGRCDGLGMDSWLTRIVSGVAESILYSSMSTNNPNLLANDIVKGSDGFTYVTTNIEVGPNVLDFGLISLAEGSQYWDGISRFDSLPLALIEFDGSIFICGPFTNNCAHNSTNNGNYSLPYLAELSISTGLDEFEEPIIGIAPNPTSGIINLSSHEKISLIEIFDQSQRLILRIEEEKGHIDLSTYPRGVYYLNFKTSSGILQRRIVKV